MGQSVHCQTSGQAALDLIQTSSGVTGTHSINGRVNEKIELIGCPRQLVERKALNQPMIEMDG